GLAAGTYTVVVVGGGMETVVQNSVAVKDGQDLKLDFTLQEAQPFKVVRSAGGKAIPLTDDYYSASFADAPEIQLDEAWRNTPDLPGSGTLLNWKPTDLSGKVRVKYSDVALHLAADLNFKTPGVNNWPDNGGREIWDGNHIDFDFQNDRYDPKRTSYDKDHDWQVLVKLADPPAFSVRQYCVDPEGQNPPKENSHIQDFILRK